MTLDDDNKRGKPFMMRQKATIDKEEDNDEDKEKKNTLSYLFKFNCNLSKNRTISSADWNPVNTDLLAVTYGELDLNVDKEGYVMFWTLKNPSYPERIIKYPSRITCCKFSQ